jgi:hypothetical protein
VEQPDTGVRTGHPEVDAVLGALDGLAERPVAEQVKDLEAADARLRGLLSDPA